MNPDIWIYRDRAVATNEITSKKKIFSELYLVKVVQPYSLIVLVILMCNFDDFKIAFIDKIYFICAFEIKWN